VEEQTTTDSKDVPNMEERGLHSQPAAIESEVEGEAKRRSYNER
jgi:hypothetical protein